MLGDQELTVPIPEHGLSQNVLRNDPRLGVGLSRDSLEVAIIYCCLVGDAGSVDRPFDSCEGARKILHLSARVVTHLR